MKRVAVFIDAGYFWVQLSNILLGSHTSRILINVDYDELRNQMLRELATQFGASHDLLRVYWYDGPGNHGKTAEHLSIDKLDDFKLRLGTRSGAGTQKGVDGLIIADLISLTQQKAISHALLMTGDADIAPGVIAAQGMGLRVHLLSLGSAAATSPYLAAEADFKRSWGRTEAASFATPSTPVVATPALAQSTPAISQFATTGTAIAAATATTATSAPAVAIAVAVSPSVDFPTVAKTAYAEMQNGNLAGQLTALMGNKSGRLPQDIDAFLLSSCRKLVGRSLDEPEKRLLRSEFRMLL